MIIDDPGQNRQFFGSVRSATPKSPTLLTGWYTEPDAARRAELDECLQRNLDCPHVHAVHLFIEDTLAPAPPEHPKVTALTRGVRTTFAAYFQHANQIGGRCIIANSDIYFDATLGLLSGRDLDHTLLCLSRWDVKKDGGAVLYQNAFSQDAWIFDAPLHLDPRRVDFTLGRLGCDGRLARVAKQSSFHLCNPARSIRAHHLHLSGIRHYALHDRVRGHYEPVPATELC